MSSAINKWTTTDGKSYQSSYYRYRNAWEETGHKCDNRTRFDMGKLDNFIIEFVKSKITNGEFANYTKESFANEIDSSLLEGEKKKLKAKLAEVISNKQSLENKIDHMPLTERNREQKLEDYNARLDDLYDLIEEINKSIKDVDKKIAGINNSTKSIEYIMDILNKFETLFKK